MASGTGPGAWKPKPPPPSPYASDPTRVPGAGSMEPPPRRIPESPYANNPPPSPYASESTQALGAGSMGPPPRRIPESPYANIPPESPYANIPPVDPDDPTQAPVTAARSLKRPAPEANSGSVSPAKRVLRDPDKLVTKIKCRGGTQEFEAELWNYQFGLPENFIDIMAICRAIGGAFDEPYLENQVWLLKAVAGDAEAVAHPQGVQRISIDGEMIKHFWQSVESTELDWTMARRLSRWENAREHRHGKKMMERLGNLQLDWSGEGVLLFETVAPGSDIPEPLGKTVSKYQHLYNQFLFEFTAYYYPIVWERSPAPDSSESESSEPEEPEP